MGLGGHKKKVAKTPIRPPWSLPETLFLETCTGCGNCLKACPEQIIVQDNTPFPKINFTNGDCTFCKACVDSCNDHVFFTTTTQPAWNHKALVSNNCLPKSGVACQSCQDACDVRAISFYPRMGGPASPEINLELCNGCGACFSVCPNDAIGFIEHSLETASLKDTTECKRSDAV